MDHCDAIGLPFAEGRGMRQNHYRHLSVMTALSFVSMYLLMYAMVNSVQNVYSNVNEVYMAGLMTAPMVVIELLVMRAMYPDKRSNALILAASVLGGIACLVLIRQQAGVSDRQFPSVDDSASCQRDPDVQRGADPRFGDSTTL